MNYSVSSIPPRGEVCFFGSSVMSGYFKNPEKTAEALHDGWLWSGDVGQINPNGSIKIVDRVKNIFKTSQGEYIAPEKLENVYVQSDWVQQCWIYGSSIKDYIVGFIVVDPDAVKKFSNDKNLPVDDQLMENEELKQIVFDSLIDLANANKFNGLERPKQIKLLKDPFTVESDILTPTMKLKRNVATKVYQADIDRLYNLQVMSQTKKK